jgi:aspartate-semialdehyde dehydrogenase
MSSTAGDQRRVAVVGATGAVGSQLVELLRERGFPFSELRLFASPESAEPALEFNDQRFPVHPLSDPADLVGFDLAFLAVPPGAASEIVRARPGPLLIDLSAAGRKPSGVPIAAPSLTSRQRVLDLSSQMLLATPHPAAEAIAGITKALGAEASFVAATLMLGASSQGRAEVADLISQSIDLLNARLSVEEDEPQIAFNIFLDEQEAELIAAISAQADELLGHPLKLALRILRVPALHGMGLAIFLPAPIASDAMRDKLSAAPGILLLEDPDPAGIVDAMNQEALCVSARIDVSGLALWCAFDNARRAAMTAIWIAECALPATAALIN